MENLIISQQRLLLVNTVRIKSSQFKRLKAICPVPNFQKRKEIIKRDTERDSKKLSGANSKETQIFQKKRR